MPDVDRSGRNAPDEHARGKLQGRLRAHARKQAARKGGCGKQDPRGEGDSLPVFVEPDVERVAKQVAGISFRHMPGQHVLGLERDPCNMAPEEIAAGRMWILFLVREMVVHPVNRDPPGRRPLSRADAEHREHVFEPPGA